MGGSEGVSADLELRRCLAELDRLADQVAGLRQAVGMRDQQLQVRAETIRRLRASRYSPRKVKSRRLARRIALIRHPTQFVRMLRRRMDRKQGRRASDRALRSRDS